MKLRILYALPALLLTAFLAPAQTFEPGLLVRANGDTLRGEIENSFWTESPQSVRFRRSAESPAEVFKPRQLRSFSLTGGQYFRYEALPIDHAAENRFEYIRHGNATNIQVDSLLAEVLVEGPVSLLRVGRLSGPHFLLLGPNQPILDLSAHEYLRQSPTGAWERTDGNNYRGLLGMYFTACPAAFTAIQKAPFTPEGLATVVQAYNQTCSPTHQAGRSWLAQAGPRRRMALQGGLLAGLRYNRIEAPFNVATGACVDCVPHPYAGLYAELLQPNRTGALYGEISLSRFKGAGTEFDYQSRMTTDYHYQAWLATARLGVRHFFRLSHERQFILGFGYELNKVLNPALTLVLGPPVTADYEVFYAAPTYLPNLDLSWRTNRLTATVDGQLYYDSRETRNNVNPMGGNSASTFFSGLFFGSNFALRLGVAYRLGRHPDDAKPAPAH